MTDGIPTRYQVPRGLIAGLVLSVLSAAAFVRGGLEPARPAVDPAILFPAGTPLLLSIDGGPCAESAKDLALSKIWHEPEVQEFCKESVDLVREQIDTNVEGVAEGLGLTKDELWQIARSRIVFGVTRFEMPKDGGGEPSMDLMLAFEFRGAKKGVEALVKMLEGQMGAGGGESAPKDVTVGGIPARSLPVPPGGPFSSVTYLIHEGWLLAATSTAQLEAALTRAKSGDQAGSLASNAFYAAAMKEVVRPKSAVSLFFDFGFVTDLMAAMDDDSMKALMGATGMESIKSISMGMELDGASIRERTFVQTTPNSMLSRLQPPMDVGALLGRIPKGAIAAYAGSMNLKEYVEYFRKLMGSVPMAGEEVDDAFTAVDQFLGAGWREELLPNLGPEIAAFLAMPQYGIVPDVGVMIKVGDQAKVDDAIAKMMDRPKAKAAHRTLGYAGKTIHYMDLGVMGIDRDMNLRPAYVFVDGYLLVTPAPHSAKSIIQTLARNDGGLMAREDFARTFGRLKAESPNAGNIGISYLDTQWLAGFLLDSAIPIVQSAVSPDDLEDAAPLKLDLGKLPSTQAITKHLSGIVTQNQAKDGGLYSETVSPTGMIGAMAVIGAGAGAVATLRMTGEVMEEPQPVEPKDDEDR